MRPDFAKNIRLYKRNVKPGETAYIIFDTNGESIGPFDMSEATEEERLAFLEWGARRENRRLILYECKKIGESSFINYEHYLQSKKWRVTANDAKERAGGRCQVCNGTKELQAHHRTYERLGREDPSDITVLCSDCHRLFHENGKLSR